MMDRSFLSWCLEVVVWEPFLCFAAHTSWGFLTLKWGLVLPL